LGEIIQKKEVYLKNFKIKQTHSCVTKKRKIVKNT